jgi:hypothetical protein
MKNIIAIWFLLTHMIVVALGTTIAHLYCQICSWHRVGHRISGYELAAQQQYMDVHIIGEFGMCFYPWRQAT